MDDSGIADAFYTVLSIGIVLIAAIAVSGVVLSTTMREGKGAGSQIADYGASGREKGLYCFYYATDSANSRYSSGDPDDITLKELALEARAEAIDLSPEAVPAGAPKAPGMALWSGYLYAPDQADYAFELRSAGEAWLWVDGAMAANNSQPGVQAKAFTLHLAKGYHPVKAKYFYANVKSASCSLCVRQGSQYTMMRSFYR